MKTIQFAALAVALCLCSGCVSQEMDDRVSKLEEDDRVSKLEEQVASLENSLGQKEETLAHLASNAERLTAIVTLLEQEARELPSPLTERAVRRAVVWFPLDKQTPPTLAEARKMLEYIGAKRTIQTAPNAMQGIFDNEDIITLWIQSYGKMNVYGVRFNGPKGRYGGGNATYFEIEK